MINSFIYFLLKFYVKLSLKIYFKHYQVEGLQNIPSGPVIFVSNHQNAFMDALLVTCATHRNPYFLARASIFNKKWTTTLLTIIRLIPIYRIRDGFSSLKKNDYVFNQCINLLSSGECILIFPEGNHDDHFFLRPFQKGAARIAFDAEIQNGAELKLSIVPIGIQYEGYDKHGSSVLVYFGKPLLVNNYMEKYEKEPVATVQLLTEDLKDRVRNLIVDISPLERYRELYGRWKRVRIKFPDLKKRLISDQKLIEKLKSDTTGDLSENNKKNSGSYLMYLLHNLIRILIKINFAIPYLLIEYIVKRKMREPMFEGSMRFALWAFGGMFILLAQSLLLYLISNDSLISLGYLALSLIFAIIYIKSKPED
jgi:1-acyl-sn-glycerol-3-phosphate acyltransferase